jgi:hypothetical protein
MARTRHPLFSLVRGRRVGFSGDVFRFELTRSGLRNHQYRNVGWLFELFGGQVGLKEAGVQARLLLPRSVEAADLAVEFGNAALLRRYADDPVGAWVSSYDLESPPGFPALMQALLEQDLVVGFELPPTMKRHLHRHGVPYLDIVVHPLRFLRDLTFGVSTNDPALASRLLAWQFHPREVAAQVRRFRAAFARHPTDAYRVPRDLPILIGQTRHDSVLVRDGRIHDWPDFEDRLAAMLSDDRDVVFVPHPFARDDLHVAEYLRCCLAKNTLVTSASGYGVLFSLPSRERFVTMSSSLGAEALMAGHDTRFLLADPTTLRLVAGVDQSPMLHLGHRLLDAPPASSSDSFHLGDNYLRRSLESWSFATLDPGVPQPQARWLHLPARSTPRADVAPLEQVRGGSGVSVTEDEAAVSVGEIRRWHASSPGFACRLRAGFHAVERWGAWTAEPRAILSVPFAACGRARFTLDLEAYDGILNRAPMLTIWVDGRLCGIAFFRPHLKRHAQLGIEALVGPGPCQLELCCDELESPAHDGTAADARLLGFALRGLCVTLLDDTAPDLASGHPPPNMYVMVSEAENSEPGFRS